MPAPTWIVSHSGGEASSSARILDACRSLGVPHVEVRMVPFSRELPPIPERVLEGRLVFYGQTSLVLAAYASPYRRGVSFDPELFRPSVTLRHLPDATLNDDAAFTTLRELAASGRADDDSVFVRPNDDLKGFAGGVMTMAALREWRGVMGEHTDGDVSADTPIVVASPKEIGREFRAVIAGETIASIDAADGRGGVPAEVRESVERAVARWRPAPTFVLDVAETERGPKILELNCFNASGLYVADAAPIVRAVSRELGGRGKREEGVKGPRR